MAMNRFGALRTIATAVRTATRPGSPGMGERLMSLPRLFRATFRGEYAGTTRGRLLMVLGAVAYVVSPIDLIPELALSVFGLADDAVVVSWIAATVVNETESFLAWERAEPSADAARRVRRVRRAETVRGHDVLAVSHGPLARTVGPRRGARGAVRRGYRRRTAPLSSQAARSRGCRPQGGPGAADAAAPRPPALRHEPRSDCAGPADVVAVLPYQLGYHPQDSIVVVALRDRAVGLIERIDLPAPEHADEAVAGPARAAAAGAARRGPARRLRDARRARADPALDALRGRLIRGRPRRARPAGGARRTVVRHRLRRRRAARPEGVPVRRRPTPRRSPSSSGSRSRPSRSGGARRPRRRRPRAGRGGGRGAGRAGRQRTRARGARLATRPARLVRPAAARGSGRCPGGRSSATCTGRRGRGRGRSTRTQVALLVRQPGATSSCATAWWPGCARARCPLDCLSPGPARRRCGAPLPAPDLAPRPAGRRPASAAIAGRRLVATGCSTWPGPSRTSTPPPRSPCWPTSPGGRATAPWPGPAWTGRSRRCPATGWPGCSSACSTSGCARAATATTAAGAAAECACASRGAVHAADAADSWAGRPARMMGGRL